MYFPAWLLGKHPDWPIILSTYADSFASYWGRRVRLLMNEVGNSLFDGLQVGNESSSASVWELKGHTGGLVTAGVGGQITGKGARVLIIDDPVKDAMEAASTTFQRRNLEWFRSTASTRLEPGGAIVILMTRWNRNDLVGMLTNPEISEDADSWDVVNLPAIAIEEDILGRKPGDALWPERFDIKALEKIRATLGARWFETMYQQSPTLDSDAALWKREWFRYIDIEKRDEIIRNSRRVVMGIDPAAGSAFDNAETGIVVACLGYDDVCYVLADCSIRGTPLQWATRAAEQYRYWSVDKIVAEDNQGGEMVEHTLRTVQRDLKVYRETARESKEGRAYPVASLYEQGKVVHVGRFPALENQMCTWVPGEGRSPDRVDALVHAIRDLRPNIVGRSGAVILRRLEPRWDNAPVSV